MLLLLDINDLNNPEHWSKHIPLPPFRSFAPSTLLFILPPFFNPIFLLFCVVRALVLPYIPRFPPSKDRGHSWNKGCFCTSWGSRSEAWGRREGGLRTRQGGKQWGQRVRWKGEREGHCKKENDEVGVRRSRKPGQTKNSGGKRWMNAKEKKNREKQKAIKTDVEES